MLPGLTGAMSGLAGRLPTFKETLDNLALTTNLKLCLDAGDPASYSSGQKWLDRSGGGYDFFLGSDGSATSTDPTFNGSAGGQSGSEYWSFDGGDSFTYDTTPESWMSNMHKDSAKFTIMAWMSLTSSRTNFLRAGSTPGLRAVVNDVAGTVGVEVSKDDGSAAFEQYQSVTIPTGNAFVAIRLDEAANTWSVYVNGNSATSTCTFTAPSASDAGTTTICPLVPNTTRLYSIAIHEGTALSLVQIGSVYSATKAKFGL